MARNQTNYFEIFSTVANYANSAAEILNDSIQNFSQESLTTHIEKMHLVEHNADMEKHHLSEKLVREFLPPIEREDIINLANRLDDVIDSIEDILLRFYMFNVSFIHSDVQKFVNIIINAVKKMCEAVKELSNFKKSTSLKDLLIEINNFEEECDKLYTQTIRQLYLNSNNPIFLATWREIFQRFEHAADNIEHTADTIEEIIMKNN